MLTRLLGVAALIGALAPVAGNGQMQYWNPYAGQVVLFPYIYCPNGWVPAVGQGLGTTEYEVLHSNVGGTWGEWTDWGPRPRDLFRLPDLRDKGPDGSTLPPSEGPRRVPYCLAYHGARAVGDYPYQPYVGQVGLFAFPSCPRGWTAAAGQTLSIPEHAAMFLVIGSTYGGDGILDFALPDLRDEGPRGDLPWDRREQRLHYCIAHHGAWPKTVDGRGPRVEPYRPYLGEIALFAFDSCPRGWGDTAGQTLGVREWPALYSLLFSLYGGDSRMDFTLPDLRDKGPDGSTLPPADGPRRLRYCIALDGGYPPRG